MVFIIAIYNNLQRAVSYITEAGEVYGNAVIDVGISDILFTLLQDNSIVCKFVTQ